MKNKIAVSSFLSNLKKKKIKFVYLKKFISLCKYKSPNNDKMLFTYSSARYYSPRRK